MLGAEITRVTLTKAGGTAMHYVDAGAICIGPKGEDLSGRVQVDPLESR